MPGIWQDQKTFSLSFASRRNEQHPSREGMITFLRRATVPSALSTHSRMALMSAPEPSPRVGEDDHIQPRGLDGLFNRKRKPVD
jgi:hypothetical protein